MFYSNKSLYGWISKCSWAKKKSHQIIHMVAFQFKAGKKINLPVLPLQRRTRTMREYKGSFWSHGNNLFHDLGNGYMNLFTWWTVCKTPQIKDKQAMALAAVWSKRLRAKIRKQPMRKCEKPVKFEPEKEWRVASHEHL